METVTLFVEEFVNEIRSTINDEMLIGKIPCRIDTSEQLDHTEPVESAMGTVNGTEDLFAAIFCGCISFFDCEILPENSFLIADMTGSDELIPAADTKIEIFSPLRFISCKI